MTRTNDNIRELIEIPIKGVDSEFSGRATYSTLFLAAAFKINLNDIGMYEHFVNAYIDDFEFVHLYKRPLFVLLKVKQFTPKFAKVDRTLSENPNHVYTYTVGYHDGELYFMYVFECPKLYLDDYESFKQGQYSKFSSGYKLKFNRNLQNIKGQVVESPLYGAIHKTEQMRKRVEIILDEPISRSQEYFGIPTKEIEVFRFKN